MTILQTDFLIARDSTKNIFKINMNKKTRKKKTKTDYISAFDCFLTEAETTRRRKNKTKKMKATKQKKELMEAKKIAVVNKKLDAEVIWRANRRRKKRKNVIMMKSRSWRRLK